MAKFKNVGDIKTTSIPLTGFPNVRATGKFFGTANKQVIYDYYVATDGLDTNPGTKEEPFLTINKANTVITTDESVWVEQGTYIDNAETFTHGYWHSNGAIIQPDAITTSLISLSGTDKKYFKGFIFDGNSQATNTIYANSVTSNGEFVNCTFINPLTYALEFNSSAGDGWTYTGCTFTGGSSGLIHSYSDDITFDNCTVTTSSTNTFYFLTAADNITIKNCTISQGGGSLFACRSSGSYDINNNNITATANISGIVTSPGTSTNTLVFDSNTINCTYISSDNLISCTSNRWVDVTITNNIINVNNVGFDEDIILITPTTSATITGNTITHLTDELGTLAEIRVLASANDVTATITGNTINANHLNGYNIKVGSESTSVDDDRITATITGNTINSTYTYDELAGAGARSIHCGFNKAMTIEDNIITGSGRGIAYEHDGTANTGGAIDGNEFYDCEMGLRIKGVSSVEMSNNIIKSEKSYCTNHIYITKQGTTEYSLNSDINNNTLYLGTGITMAGFIVVETGSTVTQIDYDIVYGVSDDPNYIISGVTFDGWSAIQGAGYEANGSNTNPY